MVVLVNPSVCLVVLIVLVIVVSVTGKLLRVPF